MLISSDGDDRGFSAKVADFGLSRVLGAEAVNTGTYGTVTHMPPELLTTGTCCDSASTGISAGAWVQLATSVQLGMLCRSAFAQRGTCNTVGPLLRRVATTDAWSLLQVCWA